MSNNQIFIFLFISLLTLNGCVKKKERIVSSGKNDWMNDSQVKRSIKNVNFTFPATGFAFERKEQYVKECFDAMSKNSELIKLTEFKDTIYIRFLSSREEKRIYTGQKSSGSAWPHIKTLYVVANENQKPPIKHELMHLMSMLEWGYENPTSNWINEGLGTFAGNDCNGYNVAQIYRFLIQTDKLIPMELITSDFYNQPEMIGYHQSAYIVEYLLANYGVEQLKKLWKNGFEKFEEIYGVPFSKIKKSLEKKILDEYPVAPEIDWEEFNKGCN